MATEEKLALAALKLAVKNGWENVTLDAVAKTARLPLAQVKKTAAQTADLLPLIVRWVDTEMEKSIGKPDKTASTHDRLFEIFMARFDILQQHRAGFLAIIKTVKRNPQQALTIAQAQFHSLQKVANYAGMTRPLSNIALLVLYNWTLCAWQRDDSTDLSRTMATLDRSLRQAKQIAALLPQKS